MPLLRIGMPVLIQVLPAKIQPVPFRAAINSHLTKGTAFESGIFNAHAEEIGAMHAKYFSLIKEDNGVFRFIIRDRAGLRPSIHGFGRTMDEAQAKIDEILHALEEREQQAA